MERWSIGVLEYRAAANCIRYAGLRMVKWCVREMPPVDSHCLTLGLVRELVRPYENPGPNRQVLGW